MATTQRTPTSPPTIYQYATKSWPIVKGCDMSLPCAERCWAKRACHRLASNPDPKIANFHTGLTDEHRDWTGAIKLNLAHLCDPLRWRQPQRVAVAYHGDLFLAPDSVIDQVFAIMLAAATLDNRPNHRFLLLSKRTSEMGDFFTRRLPAALIQAWALAGDGLIHLDDENTLFSESIAGSTCHDWDADGRNSSASEYRPWGYLKSVWPLPNTSLGVSITNQADANRHRKPMQRLALQGWSTWVSYEPALGPVNWAGWEFLTHLVCGAESGPRARPCNIEWLRAAIQWGRFAQMPIFCKQLGSSPYDTNYARALRHDPVLNIAAHKSPFLQGFTTVHSESGIQHIRHLHVRDRKGSNPAEWPADLRVRELPGVTK